MEKKNYEIENIQISIEILKDDAGSCLTKISNLSNHDIEIYVRPVKPKRKIMQIFIIKARSFTIYEYAIDLSQLLIGYKG